MSLFDLEDLLGVPREHLEFSLWYLKEHTLITRNDNARYAITVRGADEYEKAGVPSIREDRLLPEGSPNPGTAAA
jgi:hypothetical protein